MLQNAYKFDSTPPDSLDAARAETPVEYGKTRGQTRSKSNDSLQRLLLQPIQDPPITELQPSKIQKKGGKSRKKRSRKRR
jgi:hypothetical protein